MIGTASATLAQKLKLAVEFHQRGNFPQAEQLYRQILDVDPQNVDAWHLLGLIAGQVGRHELASEYILEAIRLKPSFAEAHNNLGNAYRDLGRLDEARASFQRALLLKPDYAEAHTNLGDVLRLQGMLDEAVASYQRALLLNPNLAEAHNNLGNAFRDQGKLGEAAASYHEALRLRPDLAEAHNNLGSVLQDQGKLAEAIASYRRSTRLRPDFADAHANLGNAFQSQGELKEAVRSYQQALRLKPDHAEAHNNLGQALWSSGDVEDAAASYRQAIRYRPDLAEAHVNLGTALLAEGRIDEALASVKHALSVSPGCPMAYHQLGRLVRDGRYRISEAEIDQVQRLLMEPRCSFKNKALLHFTLAYILEQKGEYDLAFEHYREGNACRRQSPAHRAQTFDIKAHRRNFDDIIHTFDPPLFTRLTPLGHPSEVPVFIVGMPRSGTTLVEQILSSHPRFAGAGELLEIEYIINDLPLLPHGPAKYPASIAELGREAVWGLAERYLKRLQRARPQALRVSDKMPLNYVHLGLIAVLFPRARVIHCRRDPRDTCVSCFCENFSTIRFSSSLEDLGQYYGEYERLMAHWRQVLPVPMFEIRYEDLVSRQEAVSRELVAFCGLDWDSSCLQFHQTRRTVHTASTLQVRQPIYARSVGRWHRYRSHLGPLLNLLGPYLTEP